MRRLVLLSLLVLLAAATAPRAGGDGDLPADAERGRPGHGARAAGP
jgi:hypothetical protein